MSIRCGICDAKASEWGKVEGYNYSDCDACGSIAIASQYLEQLDNGTFQRTYDESYWADEDFAARERSWGSSIARASEAILLCQRPVERFIDIGTGPGYLLEALKYHLPSSADRFYGIEANPPEKRTEDCGYRIGYLGDLTDRFDCGICVEVVEHLTPLMLQGLARQLAERSQPDAFYLFNTGLAPFVRQECPEYIDPLKRGHVVAWGWQAIRDIFEPLGFVIHRLGDRDWLFGAEFLPVSRDIITDRIWTPRTENLQLLNDRVSGSVLHILARESVRAYA